MNKPKDTVTEIPLSEIRDFPDHPYQVRDDDSMLELVDSIKERGLIQPVLVRPVDDGYEMVSGHRRKRAYELAGIDLIPARVKELSRDEAILAMVDSNLQREQILPSEKAKAYKMRLEAMKRQGMRTDLTSVPSAQKAHEVLAGTKAEAYVDTGVKILIAVVIGALLLAGLYALFNTTIMPNVTQKVNELFNYNGA